MYPAIKTNVYDISKYLRSYLNTKLIYSSSTEVTIEAGNLNINDRLYNIDSDILLAPSLTASSWHYVYISQPANTDIISSSDVVVSTTAPTFSSSKVGWYDTSGLQRCIGVFKTNATPEVISFRNDGYVFLFDEVTNVGPFLSTTTSATGATLLSTGCPSLGQLLIKIVAEVDYTTDMVRLWVWHGDSTNFSANADTAMVQVESYGSGATLIAGSAYGDVFTNTSGQIYYATKDSGGAHMYLRGFYLPKGLKTIGI